MSNEKGTSDNAVFLAILALTGAIALLLFLPRGWNLGDLPPIAARQSQEPEPPVVQSAAPAAPTPLPPLEREYSLEQQQSSQLEQIHTLVDRQQEQIARLNGQIEQMQLLIEQQQQSLTMMNDRERFIEAIADEQLKAPFGQANDFRTAMLWAVGGIVLVMTVGGGIVLVGIIALLLDPNRRAARMSQIAPPMQFPPYPFYPQQTEFLPPEAAPSTKRSR